MAAKKTSTRQKKSTAGKTSKSKAAASKKTPGKKTASKKTTPRKPTRAAVNRALVEVEARLMQLRFDNPKDQARVKRMLAELRRKPIKLNFTKEQQKLAEKYGAGKIWWVDEKCERGEDIIKKQIEFVEYFQHAGAKITLAVEAMRKAAGGAPVLCPQTVSVWKKKYPDFGQALLFCEVRDFEMTGQALNVATLGKKGFGPIVFKLVNQSNRLSRKANKENSPDWLKDIEHWENIQRMEVGLADGEDNDLEIRTSIRRTGKEKKEDGSG